MFLLLQGSVSVLDQSGALLTNGGDGLTANLTVMSAGTRVRQTTRRLS